jgi:hypothetical protein
MGWYDIISLLSDTRIRFLLGFIVVAIVVAIVLILIEIFFKERERSSEKKTEQTPEDRIKIYINSNKRPQEKLAYLNKIAKEYFEDMYDFPSTTSYSTLAEELKKLGKKKEVEFCNKMFEIFYSKEGLDKVALTSLGKLLIEIEGHRTKDRKVERPMKKPEVKILSKGAEVALGVKDIETEKTVIKNPKEEIEKGKLKVEESLGKESLGKEDEKTLVEEEARTKKRLEILAKHDDRQREKENIIFKLKKESETRIVERKKLIDERRTKRDKFEKERNRKEVLAKEERDTKKERKREAFWKAKNERTAISKLRTEERDEVRRLEEERKSQALKEKKINKQIKKDLAKSEAIEMNGAEGDKADLKNEGIAAKIVRLQRERLNDEDS